MPHGGVNNNTQYNYGAQNAYGGQQGGYGSAAGGDLKASAKPKKFAVIDGVMKRNPAYDAYMAQQNGGQQAGNQVVNNQLALPVVANMAEHAAFSEASAVTTGQERPLAESTNATIEMMQEPEIAMEVGLASDELVEELGEVFAKHEVPMGLMNKLYMLSEFDKLEFIIDDSGSMNSPTGAVDRNGRELLNDVGAKQTRWDEAKGRLKELVEILAYVPKNDVSVVFFNRRNTVNLSRQGSETPEQYISRANLDIDRAFNAEKPMYRTPALRVLQKSIDQGRGKSVSRYFFCDGQPDGGAHEVDQIKGLIKNRQNPERNPITFMSCSEIDDDVEWMKELEEVASYAAEYDDYESEAKEVLGDQGQALPFTRGFYLVSQLVAAFNPDDLDAMDESVPFTKNTLDNLLGYKTNRKEYEQYFAGFEKAQSEKRPGNQMDRVKKNMNWAPHFHDFLSATVAKQIPAVQQFQQQLHAADGNNSGGNGFGNSGYGNSAGNGYGSNNYGSTGSYGQGGYGQGGYGNGNNYNNGANQNNGRRRGLGGLLGRRV